ncbi:hypothetical protein [Thalassospira sp.]|uniref:hypothetical protein n=1 Tax=Thalassospira sp. TaxID=1912094 RepID=UPI002732B541|nr:hypothetical protein [Thalassospira sp.]MDP2700088.1 hypothetical protein [Thalassospira sp.]
MIQPLSRQFAIRACASLLALSGLWLAAPDLARSQQLEPFLPPPNSLSRTAPNSIPQVDDKPAVAFEEEMRNFVIKLSRWAKTYRTDFSVIALNGLELTEFLETSLFATRGTAEPARNYIRSLDGLMIESPFYGIDSYGVATEKSESDYILGYLNRLKADGLRYFMIDYTDKIEDVRAAMGKLSGLNALYYAAPPPDKQLSSLTRTPVKPMGENPHAIDNIRDARNYAVIVDSSPFGSKEDYVAALADSNYDILIFDAFHRGMTPLTFDDIKRLRYKKLGTPRTLLAWMNIGTAETYRYYWQANWVPGAPEFISEPNSTARWGQEHHVHYWAPAWQNVIFGTPESYLGGLMQLGFDGVVLSGLEEYRWWLDY